MLPFQKIDQVQFASTSQVSKLCHSFKFRHDEDPYFYSYFIIYETSMMIVQEEDPYFYI